MCLLFYRLVIVRRWRWCFTDELFLHGELLVYSCMCRFVCMCVCVYVCVCVLLIKILAWTQNCPTALWFDWHVRTDTKPGFNHYLHCHTIHLCMAMGSSPFIHCFFDVQGGRRLVISRTFRDEEGREYVRDEVVKDQTVIDAYVYTKKRGIRYVP